MRPITFTVVLFGGTLLSCTAFASGEACTLIAQTQVSAALEIPVNPGTPISTPSTCQWIGKGSSAFEVRVYGFEIDKAKSVAKTLCQTVAGKI